MEYLSRENLRHTADVYLAGYERRVCKEVKPMRISPDLMADELLDLNVTCTHLSQDGSILGMTAFSPFGVEVWDDTWQRQIYFFSEGDILIEKSLSEDSGLYNFTLMHEIAHQILHRRFSSETKKDAHRYVKALRTEMDWIEWQADTLASYLLMPEAVVRRVLHLVMADYGFSFINPNLDGKSYRKFCNAAEMLGVSKSAFKVRLKQLGLLRYCRTNELIDIWKEDDIAWNRQIAS